MHVVANQLNKQLELKDKQYQYLILTIDISHMSPLSLQLTLKAGSGMKEEVQLISLLLSLNDSFKRINVGAFHYRMLDVLNPRH